MEKIAIRIKDYKNIRNQIFCFSPEFNCEYLENKEDFEFTKKENYVNIFPKNINITAIVGKNGTGKSSILKAFLESVESSEENSKIHNKNEYINNFITVYWDYSITDESFLNIIAKKDNDKYNKNYKSIIIPSKVDDKHKSKIDLIQDIQNLVQSIFSINNIEEIVNSFFKIEKIIIATNKKQDNLKNIELTYFKDYYDFKGRNFYYEVDIKEKDKIKELVYDENNFIDFISKDDKKLLFLSFGEIQLLKILCNIQNIINKITNNENKNILFLLDELELGLHPQWQKMIINLLSKMTVNKDKKVFFVLTSHSPFLLSDLPKENVIFLDKFDEKTEKKYTKLKKDGLENGNCINVSDEVDINPFGANIHTLLSNGFFMENGLMGEFAKEKINDVYKFLINEESNVKTKEEAQNIINLIGEPLIKRQLEDIYNRKFQIKSKDEIIQELQNKIAELEKNQNDSN